MKLILPKKLIADLAKLSRTLTNALNGVAKDIQIDLKVTTQTWKHKVEFPISSPSAYRRIVATDDEVYGYVNDGTQAHTIVPRTPGGVLRFNTPFTSKTLPNQIMSRAGSVGATEVIARGVQHPGTEARKFDVAIRDKWDKQFGPIMQRAIDSEVSS
jgi:hypothetical protein